MILGAIRPRRQGCGRGASARFTLRRLGQDDMSILDRSINLRYLRALRSIFFAVGSGIRFGLVGVEQHLKTISYACVDRSILCKINSFCVSRTIELPNRPAIGRKRCKQLIADNRRELLWTF